MRKKEKLWQKSMRMLCTTCTHHAQVCTHTHTHTDSALNTHCNTWCPAGAARLPSPALQPSGSISVPAHSSEDTKHTTFKWLLSFQHDWQSAGSLSKRKHCIQKRLRSKFHLILIPGADNCSCQVSKQSKLLIQTGLRCIFNLDLVLKRTVMRSYHWDTSSI